ncbi:sensor domain-containing diguanylate cyclase [Lacticaseibacillus porcinae]|uniref:GGDEF domain-containing protein n=1 Tax=Lacticaseibacillus porcinae TaxID=1123687 RepID=UPI0013DE5AFF|nr:diguanylate cyclase [Lacticaseibacillus porcinae]
MIQEFIADVPLLLVRLLTLSFFSIGFIQYFQRVYSTVFDDHQPRRAYLMVLAIAGGLFVHFVVMVQPGSQNIIIYHNLALFMLVTPLLFEGFNHWEVAAQFIAIALLWWSHHQSNFSQPVTLLAMVAFGALLWGMHQHGHMFLTKWAVGVPTAFVYGSLFWLSTPAVSANMPMTWAIRVENVLLFGLMLAFVLGYWGRQSQIEAANRQLQELAYHDQHADTRYADQQKEFTELVKQAQSLRQPLTFATFDLDHFRQVNDQYGHLAGNAVLIQVEQRLKKVLEDSGVDHRIYATTGEEFNLVFPNATPQALTTLLETCWQAIRKGDFDYEGHGIALTMSGGVTALQPSDEDTNDLYKRADDSLSISKRAGRDIVTIDGKRASGNDKVVRHVDDYRFFAQGVYEITATGKIRRSNELLLRTYDPLQQRWVLPDTFELPAWMQISLIQEFMHRTGASTMNINLTANQFDDLDFATAMTQFVESSDGPKHLNIEITHLSDSATTRRISALYRAAGVKLMIDDVGSDNSFELVQDVLGYVNNVKFAMQNLRKQTSPEQLKQRASFWVKVAKQHHLTFVLEGVENEADVALARELGVLYVQGYYFGKPSLVVPDATVAVTF